MVEKPKMPLKDYWNMLAEHDWFFNYSDDPYAYRAGYNNNERLLEIANRGAEYRDLYVTYSRYIFNGAPQPPCPP